MELQVKSLPSLGWKSGLGETFNMEPFGPKQFPLLAKASESNDIRYLLVDALSQVLDIDHSVLTIPDAHSLVFMQRMQLSKTRPLGVQYRCVHPIFQYADGESTDLDLEKTLLGQRPCGTVVRGEITTENLMARTLDATHPEFNLPRMRYYDEASESLFNWTLAHMGESFYDSKAHMEESGDLKLFGELTAWVIKAQHGLLKTVDCRCPQCGLVSQVAWNMPPSVFML